MRIVLLLALVPLHAAAILQIRVVEGEGAVYAAGSRATRGITVQVTDETGRPVDGAAVSFRLPESGPGGTFNGGLKSDIAMTGPDGRATVWGMRWNTEPGAVEIRITAAKENARAGTVTSVYISDKLPAAASPGGMGRFTVHHSHKKWLIMGAAVAGAALGGMAISGKSTASASTAANTPLPPQVGTPTINVGPHP